jgi:hypothetical protein
MAKPAFCVGTRQPAPICGDMPHPVSVKWSNFRKKYALAPEAVPLSRLKDNNFNNILGIASAPMGPSKPPFSCQEPLSNAEIAPRPLLA